MTDDDVQDPAPARGRLLPADLSYAIALFVAAAVAIAMAIAQQGGVLLAQDVDTALFFLIYGLFTISIGYPHPHFGYYSFDRVSQVASILVLGPVDAAWINGLASLIYPWHRLWKGASPSEVLVASINNSGMMALMILLAGLLYTSLGGPVPLQALTGGNIALLLVLVLGMQVLNDVGMLGLLRASGGSPRKFFNLFSVGLELGSAATAVLVAIVFNVMDAAVFALLLGVLTLGMLSMRQFAFMRYRLELLVEERTRDLHEKSLELERQATQDTLTGLYNRRYADEFLERQVGLGAPPGQFVIALADIDLFKQINDGHSHATGDEVLRRVADIMRKRCRNTDVIARYGGEEFLLCFPDTRLEAATCLCEELRIAVEREDWAPLGLRSKVTLSFGIAASGPDATPGSLLAEADDRLYSAKRHGRNRVVA
ncbi:MAG: diguanylate cyclase [Gammaproteobacteria bacterium]|nr:diguanylate cyclase [Gammaproteobacteria bacterium]